MMVLHFARKSVLAEIRADTMALEARDSRAVEACLEQWTQEDALMGCVCDRILVHPALPVFQGTGCTALPMKFKVGAPCDDASE